MSTSTAPLSDSDGNDNNMQSGTVPLPSGIYVYQIDESDMRNLCVILDEDDVWLKVAAEMGYQQKDINRIKYLAENGSPAAKLIEFWGDQGNHKVSELFMVLYSLQLYPAMECIREYVDKSHHRLISMGQPHLSALMRSEKLINGSIMSNENNTSERSLTEMNAHFRDEFNLGNGLPRIPYEELKEATGNWDETKILGRGGFGCVFRGTWKMTDVAIKRIEYHGHSADQKEAHRIELQQIANELEHLSSCRHDNVLPLYGWSCGGPEPCLVYQMMAGGSLESRLANRRSPLTFEQRVRIANNVALGLYYLHNYSTTPLIHGDIKPANILLDPCCIAKIADFGLSRRGTFDGMEVSKAYGTKPFLPDEFLRDRLLSTKVDTYSFGVVLFVLMTNLRAYDKSRSEANYLAKYMAIVKTSPTFDLLSLADKSIDFTSDNEAKGKVYQNIINCGLLCTLEQARDRPEMKEVREILVKYT